MPIVEKVPVSSVGDAAPKLVFTVGVHQHSREYETEQGGSQYAALLHSVGHCECFGYRPIVSDVHHHPVIKLTHHVREPLMTAEFLHDFSESVAIPRVKGFRYIHEAGGQKRSYRLFRGVGGSHIGFPGAGPVQGHDGRVFEILRNLSLAPHLLEECCEFCHQPGPTVLVDFRWDCVGSRCFTAGNLLHGPDGFW
ncbi:unnamed protein product [Schistocephalus solidus]|uniref:Uncharacterized protein n=1 Tax=Schistocephalus solidus TaxID=70667 RepID=A0A183SAH8_SCHSO|nr:unnamed protein product [Schistocephalus solidus]